MIIESVTKSSLIVDTTFRKDLTLQGCTTLSTRTNRLLMPAISPLPWKASRGWMATLYSCANLSMIHRCGVANARTAVLPAPTQPLRPHAPQSQVFHTNEPYMYHHTHSRIKYRTRGPMDRCAQASSRRESPFSMRGCTLSLGSEGENLVLGRQDRTK